MNESTSSRKGSDSPLTKDEIMESQGYTLENSAIYQDAHDETFFSQRTLRGNS